MDDSTGALRRIAKDVRLGRNVVIRDFVNLYGCSIGDESRIGSFVEIQKNAIVGARCKISSHAFICEGVTIEDECFVGHLVCFINDRRPRSTTATGKLQGPSDWSVTPTLVRRGASIGSGAVIMCGEPIGEGALIGAGAVVTKVVPGGASVAGVPARVLARGGAPKVARTPIAPTTLPIGDAPLTWRRAG
jgi:acetyltransferase-like isoleucine patch superfamily enzyme